MELNNDEWDTNIPDYTFDDHVNYYKYSVVFYNNGFYFFGGKRTKTIARLDSVSFEWEELGQLNHRRKKHNTIEINGIFLVVGGDSYDDEDMLSEKCVLDHMGKVICSGQEPTLINHTDLPALFKVTVDYCHLK